MDQVLRAADPLHREEFLLVSGYGMLLDYIGLGSVGIDFSNASMWTEYGESSDQATVYLTADVAVVGLSLFGPQQMSFSDEPTPMITRDGRWFVTTTDAY